MSLFGGTGMAIETITGLGRALFVEAGDGLFLFDPDDDRLLDVNPMAERLTGCSCHDLLQKPATYWFRFAGKNGSKDRLRQASSHTGVFHAQDGFVLPLAEDGVWIPVNLTVTRLHVKPKVLALLTVRDVRENALYAENRCSVPRRRLRAPRPAHVGVGLPVERRDFAGRPVDVPLRLAGRRKLDGPAAARCSKKA